MRNVDDWINEIMLSVDYQINKVTMGINSFIKNNHKCWMRNRMSNHHFSFLISHFSLLYG